ncbi:DUF2553 family protein [Pontibacillus litoralis]|uniref:Uncharacterized protein n=1 Tax=Pontibacillus litoralis JSM 072002 TaxID=1385512 RepID=A0A0A5G176_9BACI|nr:DUF2553 family protein [Pontibacillus litoralis]KGX85794.1 hypothetical protein N784_08055 [Pontibacillus litoralis JSM 072002]
MNNHHSFTKQKKTNRVIQDNEQTSIVQSNSILQQTTDADQSGPPEVHQYVDCDEENGWC